jgi:hypothetical protein
MTHGETNINMSSHLLQYYKNDETCIKRTFKQLDLNCHHMNIKREIKTIDKVKELPYFYEFAILVVQKKLIFRTVFPSGTDFGSN